MATCEGEFSKRHNAPGCSSSLAPVKKGLSRGNRTRGSLSAPASSMSTREEKKSQVKHWEPLSVNALLEYNLDSLRAPGSGEFLFGKSKTWKIQWNWASDRFGFRYVTHSFDGKDMPLSGINFSSVLAALRDGCKHPQSELEVWNSWFCLHLRGLGRVWNEGLAPYISLHSMLVSVQPWPAIKFRVWERLELGK